ncbi:hypothetical protein IJT10_03410, partial [bacterium]|nr:hypothetical protein [bacterium]
ADAPENTCTKYNNSADLPQTVETLTLNSSCDFLVCRHLEAKRRAGGTTKRSQMPNINTTYQAYNVDLQPE